VRVFNVLSSRSEGRCAAASEREKFADQYGRLAVELLERAHTAGSIAAGLGDYLKRDTDLDALRARDDFKKLVGELDKETRARSN
jgi:hypothetical protein